jgi:dienelactone hydrolase
MDRVAMALVGCLALLAGCGSDGGSTDLVVERELDVSGVTATDVFAPDDGDDLPVVVMLHGTGGDRSVMEPLARAVAQEGAVVYVPSWPVIDQVAEFHPDDDEPFRLQAEAVVCALRFARRTAPDFGGDPDELTLLGHSGGGMAGARVALVDVPPWPGIDCDADVAHAPVRFIGTGGDYIGEYQYADQCPELFAAYDPLSIEATNLDLQVRLIHGVADGAVCARVSARFDDHLADLGIDTALVATDTGHSDLRNPDTPGGRFVAQQVGALIHGRPSVFEREATTAVLGVGDDTCDYSGPVEVERGQLLRLELRNPTSAMVWFVPVRADPDSDLSLARVRGDRTPGGRGAPGWVDGGDFVPMPARSSRSFDWVFVDGDADWVVYCMLDPDPDHPMKQPSVDLWGGPAMEAVAVFSAQP